MHNAKCLMLVFTLLVVEHILFFGGECKAFCVNFNIESTLAAHQLPIRWQIFNSRGGSFWLKLALACIMLANHFAVHKCVFIQNGGQSTTKKVLFAANCTAFSGKTQGKMRQNAVRNAAKRKAECRKTQDGMYILASCMLAFWGL